MYEAESSSRTPRPRAGSARFSARLIVGLAAGALILGAVGSWQWFAGRPASGSGAAEEPTVTVLRGPLTIAFTERGSIMAARSEPIICTLEGLSTIVNVVPEGASVKKGDVLVELDSSELTQAYNQQQIAVETASAALLQANETVEIQKSQNHSDIRAAELAVVLAEIDAEKYEKGDWPVAVAKAEAAIRIAEEETRRAENRYAWTEKLASRGYVTRTELIADDLAVKKARVQLEEATAALRVLKEYTRKKESMTAQSNLQQARDALERARLKAASQLSQALADQKGKKRTNELSQVRLEKIKEQLVKTKIVAPQDGMVVYHTDGGRGGRENRIVEQGASVRESQQLIDLPDLSLMAVEVQVPEARIHQIQIGLPALITIDAQLEVTYRGSITKIGLLPDYVNRWLNPDLKVYRTEVTIDPDQDTASLRPGMSAKVEIIAAHLMDVVHVPVQSVTTIDGQPVVHLLRDGAFHAREVVTGPSNDTYVVLTSGLQGGETVQLNAPRPRGLPPPQKSESGGEDGAGSGSIAGGGPRGPGDRRDSREPDARGRPDGGGGDRVGRGEGRRADAPGGEGGSRHEGGRGEERQPREGRREDPATPVAQGSGTVPAPAAEPNAAATAGPSPPPAPRPAPASGASGGSN